MAWIGRDLEDHQALTPLQGHQPPRLVLEYSVFLSLLLSYVYHNEELLFTEPLIRWKHPEAVAKVEVHFSHSILSCGELSQCLAGTVTQFGSVPW